MTLFILQNLHLAATWFMVGLIWFVQVVHYPLFLEVGTQEFPKYELEHSRRTTWVVLPVMSLELACAFGIWSFQPSFLSRLGIVLVVLIWLSTLLVQSPLHAQLLAGFRRRKWQTLVSSNRFRTAAWTLRGLIAFALLHLS